MDSVTTDVATKRRSTLAEAFIDSWVSWREASEHVRTAYRLWSECAWRERALAFAGYRAALEREEHAASIHSRSAERIRAFSGPDTPETGDLLNPFHVTGHVT
jgi:hypothetical protein